MERATQTVLQKKAVIEPIALIRTLLIVFCCGWPFLAFGQATTVVRTTKGQFGKDIQVGLYINVKPDCSSSPLPTIRLAVAPEHGKVTVKKAKVNATNYKQCLALEVPGFVAFYHSKPDFAGTDTIVLEVRFPGGRTEIQKISVSVGTGSHSQRA